MAPVQDPNGWTGGQWSLVRVVSAVALAAMCIGWLGTAREGPPQIAAWLILALCFPLAAGVEVFFVSLAGLVTYTLTLPGENVFAGLWRGSFAQDRAPWLDVHAGLALLLYVWALWVEPAPFGSVPARRRADPGGGWRLSWVWHALATGALMAYVLTSAARWAWSQGLGPATPRTWHFAWAICLSAGLLWVRLHRRSRPWLWFTCTLLLLAAAAWGPSHATDRTKAVLFAVFAFDPGWIRPRRAGTTDTLFYDGGCGLCHTSVRFILAEDRSGTAFRFAPIGGAAWGEAFPDERTAPAQTLVVQTARGETLSRSTGALYIARRLGGFWRVLGTLGLVVPRPLRDTGYNGIARIRHRLFRAPSDACPLVPPEMRARFDLRG